MCEVAHDNGNAETAAVGGVVGEATEGTETPGDVVVEHVGFAVAKNEFDLILGRELIGGMSQLEGEVIATVFFENDHARHDENVFVLESGSKAFDVIFLAVLCTEQTIFAPVNSQGADNFTLVDRNERRRCLVVGVYENLLVVVGFILEKALVFNLEVVTKTIGRMFFFGCVSKANVVSHDYLQTGLVCQLKVKYAEKSSKLSSLEPMDGLPFRV